MREAMLAVVAFCVMVGAGFYLLKQSDSPRSGTSSSKESAPAVSKDTFKEQVLSSSTPVLVDFSATWCGPCRRMEPVLKDLASEYSGRLKVVKVDVDDNSSLAQKYGVSSIPCMVLFKNGKEVDRLVGVASRQDLVRAIESAQ